MDSPDSVSDSSLAQDIVEACYSEMLEFSGTDQFRSNSPKEKLREKLPTDSVAKNEDVATTSAKAVKKQQSDINLQLDMDAMSSEELQSTLDGEGRADYDLHLRNSQQNEDNNANLERELIALREQYYQVRVSAIVRKRELSLEKKLHKKDQSEYQEKLKVMQESIDSVSKQNAQLAQLKETNKALAAKMTLLEEKNEQLRVALEDYKAKLDKAVAECGAAVTARDVAKTECAAAVTARDVAKTECAAAVTAREVAKTECGAAVTARDVAKTECAAAVTARDVAKTECAAAVAARDVAIAECGAAVAARDVAKTECAAAVTAREVAAREIIVVKAERDVAQDQLATVKAERDTATAQRDSAIRERNTVITERDNLDNNCQQLRQVIAQLNCREQNTAAMRGHIQEGFDRLRAISNRHANASRHANANRHASGSYDINPQYDENVFRENQNR